MERVLLVQSLGGEEVAQVREKDRGQFSLSTADDLARDAIEELIRRGREIGLIHNHDHRQKTNKGEVFRMYGRWSKPGDPDFLDTLADALVEFNFFAYTVELV